jgi:predicted amidohydrolase
VAGLTLESLWLRQVAGLATRYHMVVIPDVLLIDGDRATNTALVYGPEGNLLGRYAKTHLAPGERQTVAAGEGIETVATPFGRLGLLICWDVHFPELTRVHELQGADLLLWTTMRQAESEEILWRAVLPARCWDHSLPLGVSTYVTARQIPLRRPMTATVFNAFGQVIAGGLSGEGVVQGTVDLDERPHDRRYWGRPDWVAAGPYYRRYRRPDLYAVLTAALSQAGANPDAEAEIARYPDLVDPVL